ncbi:MAG: V-type ATP synthase subunit D [Desulfurococcaceae archaeon TW002]
MSQQMLRLARPTKIEFIRLRRRLATARRLHRVLRDRLLILTQELVALYKEVIEHRLKIHEEIVKCEKELIRASSYVMPWTFEEFSNIRVKSFSVVVGSRIVAGVKLPLLEYEVIEGLYDPSTYPITLEEVSKCYEDLVKRIIRLAETEISLLEVGREVQKVKRKVNALENLIIPRLRATIKYLRMKFEEREREDKIRRKRIKQVLSRRTRI